LLAQPPRPGTASADLAALVAGAGGPGEQAPPLLQHFRVVLRDDPKEAAGTPQVTLPSAHEVWLLLSGTILEPLPHLSTLYAGLCLSRNCHTSSHVLDKRIQSLHVLLHKQAGNRPPISRSGRRHIRAIRSRQHRAPLHPPRRRVRWRSRACRRRAAARPAAAKGAAAAEGGCTCRLWTIGTGCVWSTTRPGRCTCCSRPRCASAVAPPSHF